MHSAGFLNVSELFHDPIFTSVPLSVLFYFVPQESHRQAGSASSDLILDRSAKFALPDLDTLSLIDRKHCKQDLVLGGNLGK